LRKLRRLFFVGCATAVTVVFGGPVSSGALFLLLAGTQSTPGPPSESSEPLHKGHVDLSTGLYIRQDEDLVVSGTPQLILRRTYLSGWRESMQFGIGTWHNGEVYLIGDPERFQWASLILAEGSRITFERTSPGTSFLNAMFEHRATPTEYQGARLGWTGLGWTMRLRDGSGASFQSCGPRGSSLCSVVETRDAESQTVRYKRERSGRLLRIEGSSERWIAFDYDDKERITRAYDSAGREVRYAYDDRGRLSRVNTFDGKVRQYTYTDRDEMHTIADPDIFLENIYDAAGRCIRQINRFPGETEPYTFRFDYRGEGRAIVQTAKRAPMEPGRSTRSTRPAA
jgi:YD repeat-containing protein